MATKDDMIADLRRSNAQQIADLWDRVSELELQLAKALKNSSNSSKSPSSDVVKPPKKKTDRRQQAKRGGPKGHPRKLREPLPRERRERVDEEILYEIKEAEVREFGLRPTDQFEIVQHVELLDLPIHTCATTALANIGCESILMALTRRFFQTCRNSATSRSSVLGCWR